MHCSHAFTRVPPNAAASINPLKHTPFNPAELLHILTLHGPADARGMSPP